MSPRLRSLFAAGATAAALALPGSGVAAPASTSFTITGYEYAFTQTAGSFAGPGVGNMGDMIGWNALVEHDPLGSSPTYVNGGFFEIVSHSPDGSFDAVLTHYRVSLFGRCVIYKARVAGTVGFTY